ncbi:hypothetical protein DXG03_002873 [Asterophora parasitica]|uniref:Uncharacterized protein n=1 Tax=Asterophora parasitica TaxID=117018 RepID=A0A9P7GFV2_9AGAR|nr:hypothetical protein DXG03_002873 [Asterophora parasitica]
MDYDDAAKLLSSKCPDHLKNEEGLELGSPESFGALFRRSRRLYYAVKDAKNSGKFEMVWKLPHSLGGFRNDPVLNERVQSIFRRGQNTFLVNASASGKTLLLYEGLCQHWGFYVTFQPDGLEPRTLREATFPDFTWRNREPLFQMSLPQPTALGFHILHTKNREIANRRFSVVLLVHLLVFREFLRAALEVSDTLTEEQKYRWFLAQWCYPFCHSSPRPVPLKDPYLELFHTNEFETPEYIYQSLAEVTKDIFSLLPQSIREDGLFVAIDEANAAAHSHEQPFHDETGFYPLLKEMIHIWRGRLSSFGVPITFIVAGNEIPIRNFPRSSSEWALWKWTSNTGAFDDQAIQRRYVASFLPPSLIASPSGELLLQRIWDWCKTRQVPIAALCNFLTYLARPRHGFTAAAVSLLLKDGFVRPHRVFNHYIYQFTQYQTEEAKDLIAREKADSSEATVPFYESVGEPLMSKVIIQACCVLANISALGNSRALYDARSDISLYRHRRASGALWDWQGGPCILGYWAVC